MVNNVPVKTLAYKDLTIEGYSRAAVQTYWRIPEFKLGFDLGAQPWSFMGTPTWFVSHTHMDHLASLPVYVARRRMMKMEPPAIYLPADAVDPVQRILRLFSRIDRGRLPCELIPMRAATKCSFPANSSSRSRPPSTRSPRWALLSGSGGRSFGRNTSACPASKSATFAWAGRT